MKYFVNASGNNNIEAAREISGHFNIDLVLAQILVSRGIDSVEKAERYLRKDLKNMHDPFLLDGMDKACEIISRVIGQNKSILIYGDYDADGICSVAALYLYFKSKNVEVNWYIPERSEGYGINADAVDFIAQNYKPDLFISADCGITAAAEVERLAGYGIEVIITDHHNSGDSLPRCVVINPKISPRYPFKDLCGCGVALKLIQALEGENGISEAEKYVDIAAIATIGDSVELKDENRDIVDAGLSKLNNGGRKGLKLLCRTAGLDENIGVYSVAFGIVPRINAAGRIGEAKRALSLFFEEDEKALKELAEELNGENQKRQALCDKLLENLINDIEENRLNRNRCIAVIDESGSDGVSGILASKLCERYYRPSFVFCRFNGSLKGSGRSIEGVNIFDMLSSMKELFEKFGGHSYAAGVTIKEENLEQFRQLCDKYLAGNIPPSCFVRRKTYDCDLTGAEVGEDFISQINVFEPCGVGNARPQFLYKAKNINAGSLKKYPSHLTFKLLNTEVIGFNFGENKYILNSDAENELLLEFTQSAYKGRLYDKGFLKDFNIDINSAAAEEKSVYNYITQALDEECQGGLCDIKPYGREDERQIIEGKFKQFGTLIVVFSPRGLNELYRKYLFLREYRLSAFDCDLNNASGVLLAPYRPKISGCDTVIFYQPPFWPQYANRFKNSYNTVYIPDEKCYNIFDGAAPDTDRETFKRYYLMICSPEIAGGVYLNGEDLFFAIKKKFPQATLTQFAACWAVFCQLNIAGLKDGKITLRSDDKKQLTQSEIYNKLACLRKKSQAL